MSQNTEASTEAIEVWVVNYTYYLYFLAKSLPRSQHLARESALPEVFIDPATKTVCYAIFFAIYSLLI